MTIEQFKERVFTLADAKGFDEYELYYQRGTALSLESYERQINSYSDSTTQGVNFRGVIAGKSGSSYTEVLDDDAATTIVEHAYQAAKLIENDDAVSLIQNGHIYPKLDLYDDDLNNVTSADKANLVIATETAALNQPLIDHVETVKYSDTAIHCHLFNSHGIDIGYRRNMAYYYIFALSKAEHDTQAAFEVAYSNTFNELKEKDIVKAANALLQDKQGASSLPSGHYPVAFSGEAFADVLAVFVINFSAERVQKDMSLLKGKLGERVASECISLIDDPHMENGLASAPFDGEGVPTYKKALIENGKLMTYLHNMNSAKKDGVKTTANASRASFQSTIGIAPSNAYVKPSQQSVDDLYRAMKDGVLITELDGLHAGANPVSGDFSLSARGYRIVDGKRTDAVKSIVVSGNFFNMLKSVRLVADDLIFKMGPIGAPTTWVGSLDIAGEK